jgi:Family of unknown function
MIKEVYCMYQGYGYGYDTAGYGGYTGGYATTGYATGGYAGYGYTGYAGGAGSYAFILVLFILLVIIGCSCYGGYGRK